MLIIITAITTNAKGEKRPEKSACCNTKRKKKDQDMPPDEGCLGGAGEIKRKCYPVNDRFDPDARRPNLGRLASNK